MRPRPGPFSTNVAGRVPICSRGGNSLSPNQRRPAYFCGHCLTNYRHIELILLIDYTPHILEKARR
jgi:hypothetical protein